MSPCRQRSASLNHGRRHRRSPVALSVRGGPPRLGAGRGGSLGVNSSVVSRQISLLEQGLDVVLLERHSRGVRATEAGALLVEHFHRRAADRDDTLAKLRDIQGLRRGHIDVAIGEGFVSDLMSGSLRSFWKQHPRLTMSLLVGGTNDIVRWVAEDQVHIGLVYNPPSHAGIRSCASSRQPISLIAKRDHPLIRKNDLVRFRDVKEQPLGLLHASYGVRQVIAVAEAAEKIGLSPVFTTSSFAALGEFVICRLGVTLLPPFSLLAAEIASGALAAIPVKSPVLMTPEAHAPSPMRPRIIQRGKIVPASCHDADASFPACDAASHDSRSPVSPHDFGRQPDFSRARSPRRIPGVESTPRAAECNRVAQGSAASGPAPARRRFGWRPALPSRSRWRWRSRYRD